LDNNILLKDLDNKLLEKQEKKKGVVTLEGRQADAFIRWEVWSPNDQCSKVWEDRTLWESWIKYYSNTKQHKTLCYVTGVKQFVAEQHPAKLRNDGDKAKLISSNDWSGFTFRGRFTDTKERNTYQTCGVGFEVTQKAHSALRWLISRQGYRSGDQAIVAWATSGKQIPDPLADPLSILGEVELAMDDSEVVSTAQNIALKFNKKMAGYKADLGDTSGIVVMGLDSATPGRMAITFYRELTGSEFLRRIEQWHETCAWVHDYRFREKKGNKKTKRTYLRFVGAPAPRDIVESAYGNRVGDKLKKATVERLLPCIIDGQKIPRDVVDSAVRRATNRAGMEGWVWNKNLSIACALFRKLNEKEEYHMALDENRKTRDYLYGRLLALADSLEQWALNKAGEDRQTNAARLMQRFAERPYSTWRTIELSLAPYKARLGGQSQKRQALIDKVHDMFDPPEDYTSDKKLNGEFLLGYHCQREALRQKGNINTNEREQETAAETVE
jgi:CRISPR-associated protein Csd1